MVLEFQLHLIKLKTKQVGIQMELKYVVMVKKELTLFKLIEKRYNLNEIYLKY